MCILKSDIFYEFSFADQKNSIYIKWKFGSRHMSRNEFLDMIDNVTGFAKKNKTEILYMDASEFNYPIPSNLLDYIGTQLLNTRIKIFGLVLSHQIIGRYSLINLIQSLEISFSQLHIFENQEDGEIWYSS
jgi:hypothetical protein